MFLLDKWQKMPKNGKPKCYLSSNLIIKYSVSFVFETWTWTYRERTVNVPWTYRERDFAIVSDRLPCTVWSLHTVQRPWPFTVPDRSSFLTVHDRSWPFLTVLDRSWPFLTVPERSWPFLSVFDRFMSVFDRFRPFYECFRSFVTFMAVLIITTYM